MFVRHARVKDLDAILALTCAIEVGMTSLPNNKKVLANRLCAIEDTLNGKLPKNEQRYLFVLEDSQTGKIAGISAIEVAVGNKAPFYDFQIIKQVHQSPSLGIRHTLKTLVLNNEYTGNSELCSLYLSPDYRSRTAGKLISKSRMLFMAQFTDRFNPIVIAEMRGYFDKEGNSPFWQHFAKQFFQMDFETANRLIGTADKTFIAELMPRFPFYVDFLPKQAQAVIGKVHPNTAPALKLLKSEGFGFNGHIDIIEAGPNLQAHIHDLRAVQHSKLFTVATKTASSDDTTDYLVSNTEYIDYRAIVAGLSVSDIDQTNQTVALCPKNQSLLTVGVGDSVRLLPLNAKGLNIDEHLVAESQKAQ